eukprot:1984675-Rhodomonas_salina.1
MGRTTFGLLLFSAAACCIQSIDSSACDCAALITDEKKSRIASGRERESMDRRTEAALTCVESCLHQHQSQQVRGAGRRRMLQQSNTTANVEEMPVQLTNASSTPAPLDANETPFNGDDKLVADPDDKPIEEKIDGWGKCETALGVQLVDAEGNANISACEDILDREVSSSQYSLGDVRP